MLLTCFVVDHGGGRLVRRSGAAATVHRRIDRRQQASDCRADHGRGVGLHLVRGGDEGRRGDAIVFTRDRKEE